MLRYLSNVIAFNTLIILCSQVSAQCSEISTAKCANMSAEVKWAPHEEVGYGSPIDENNEFIFKAKTLSSAENGTMFDILGPSLSLRMSTLRSVELSCEGTNLLLRATVDQVNQTELDDMSLRFRLRLRIVGSLPSQIKTVWRLRGVGVENPGFRVFEKKLDHLDLSPVK